MNTSSIVNWLINKFLPWRATVTKAYVAHLENELAIAKKQINMLYAEKHATLPGGHAVAILDQVSQ